MLLLVLNGGNMECFLAEELDMRVKIRTKMETKKRRRLRRKKVEVLLVKKFFKLYLAMLQLLLIT